MSNNYIVSARKYRPATFRSVVGQQALTHTLKTAIASGRLAHAYLFCGPRGVGKTTCARIFAKTINCLNPQPDGEACNECESCRAFNEQRSFNITELDAASNNGVDQMRELTEQVRIPPQVGKYRVFIIDEVHMLSQAAFNAFLKTLEEPPEYAIFILATTEKQKIIPTILSRCQIYDFARITVPDIVGQLQYVCEQENITAESAALNVIAQKADGAMRDALSIFDQVTAATGGNITYQSALENLNVLDYDYYFRLVDTFLAGDVLQALMIYKEIREKGFDSLFFVNGLAQHLRDLMVATTPAARSLLEMNDDVAQRYGEQAAKLSPRFFYRALDLCNTCDLNYRTTSSKTLLVELTLVKLCQLVENPQPQPQTSTLKPVQPAAKPAPQPSASGLAQNSQKNPPQAAAKPAPTPQPQATQPQQPQQPQAQAVPKPVSSPKPITHTRVRVNTKEEETPQVKPQTAPARSRNTPFTADQFRQAWNDFIDKHPHDQATIYSMRPAQLEPVSATTYRARVNSEAQREAINGSKNAIIAFLSDSLQNDLTDFVIEVDKSVPSQVLTPKEVVEDMKQNIPGFDKFLQDFELGLA